MRGWKTMAKQRHDIRSRQQEPSVDKTIAKKVDDEWSQRFPNDWLEATIVVVVLATMAGAAYFMYLLSQA